MLRNPLKEFPGYIIIAACIVVFGTIALIKGGHEKEAADSASICMISGDNNLIFKGSLDHIKDATEGNPVAQIEVAHYYHDLYQQSLLGNLGEPNTESETYFKKAVDWYKMAAKNPYSASPPYLALIYIKANQKTEAFAWMIASGYSSQVRPCSSAQRLGRSLERELTPSQREEAQRRALEIRLAPAHTATSPTKTK